MKGETNMDKHEAAHRLGVPVAEIADVLDSPAGMVYVTTDGQSYVDVIEPDGDGRTGLMFLAAPTEKYADTFPVYTAPADDVLEPITDGERVTEPATGSGDRDPVVAEYNQLAARARELGIKFRKNASSAKLAALIAAAEAGTAPADDDGDPADDEQDDPDGESGDAEQDDAPGEPLTDAEQLVARAGALGIDVEQFELDELPELIAAAEAAAAAGGDDE